MNISDIYELMQNSNFVDSKFKRHLKIQGSTISHTQYPRTNCEIKNNKLYATAGCLKDGKPDEGNVNQCINLQKLPHSGVFIIDSKFKYRSDRYGRVWYVMADLNSKFITRTNVGTENTKRIKEEKDATEDDDGGHLIAHCLGGPNEAINIVPQNSNVNQIVKNLESLISKLIQTDWNIKYEVWIQYKSSQSLRPCHFRYSIKGTKRNTNRIQMTFLIDNQ